jgi:hypothetical protein
LLLCVYCLTRRSPKEEEVTAERCFLEARTLPPR